MRNNLLKAFLSAVAGSAILLTALFVMNIVRSEAAVVEAAPAVAAPSLAATGQVTMTISPATSMYGEKVTLQFERKPSYNNAVTMTAYVTITMNKNKWHTTATWATGKTTTSVTLSDGKVVTQTNYTTKYPGKYDVDTTVFSGSLPIDKTSGSYTILPLIAFDSAVPAQVNLGQWFSSTVKIQPAVNYISNTNEVIDYDFQNDGKNDASVTINSTSSYTKSDKPDSTYVYTRYMFTKGTTYTMKAAYKSGIYGDPMATVTKTITVKNPTLTVKATPATVKVGDPVKLEGTTDFAVDTASVVFSVDGKAVSTVAMSGTNATTSTTTFTQTGTYSINGKLMAFGNDVTTSAPVTVTVEAATQPVVADKVVAGAVKTLEAGSTTTVSATVTGGGKPIAGQVVSFTIQAGSSTLSAVTATTNNQGVAEVKLTGGVAAGEKYETTIVHANLPGTTVAPSPVSIVVYAKGAEVPNVVDGGTVEKDITGAGAVVETTVPAGGTKATFKVTVKAGTTMTLTDGTVVPLAGGKLVVTPIVSPTNEAALKTTASGDVTLFGVLVDVYYRDAKNNLVKAPSGTQFNPALTITVTFGSLPAGITLDANTVSIYYLNETDSTWKKDGITVTAVTGTSVTFSIAHLTQFGGVVQSSPPAVYLPFIMRATAPTSSTATL